MSLAPSVTEIICALGLEDHLVGVDKWSDYPTSVQRLPKVGGIEADLDAVLALSPDLVVACTSVPGMERNIERLNERGQALTIAEPTDLAGTLRSIQTLGESLGRAAEAAVLVGEMEQRIERVVAARRDGPRPSVYWEWWPKPLSAAAGRSWMHDLIDRAGGQNLFADVDRASVRPDPEEVVRRDPQTIFVCWCGAKTLPDPELVRARPGWEQVQAVVHDRIFVMPEGLFARPGPRLVDGLERLVGALAGMRSGPV